MRADCSWELPKDAGYDGEPLIVIATVQMGLVTLPPWLAFVPAECRVVTARLNIICMVGESLNCPLLHQVQNKLLFVVYLTLSRSMISSDGRA